MSTEKQLTILEAHQEFAKTANHHTWDLLDQSTRTPEEEKEMILAASTSLYHWLMVGTAAHAQRGYWLLSRVHLVLGRTKDAFDNALKCQSITDMHQGEMADFDLAFSQEGLARVFALSGNLEKALIHHKRAAELGQAIKDPEDKQIFLNDFESGEWFGIV
jgi:hypothetical protein